MNGGSLPSISRLDNSLQMSLDLWDSGASRTTAAISNLSHENGTGV
jgi:hypothetical protein